MTLHNTTNDEDRAILEARNATAPLVEIIERLDGIIEAWKDVSGCDSPQDLEEAFLSLMMGADE